jgi:hypothetical protein
MLAKIAAATTAATAASTTRHTLSQDFVPEHIPLQHAVQLTTVTESMHDV